MRRMKAVFIIIVLLSSVFQVMPGGARAADDSITIHYHRDDGEYDKWNIWAWPFGADGAAYPFDDEDAFGKVANITISKPADQIGFIVRTDAWDKDFSDDRFIDTSIGTEIWVMSGQGEFYYEAPAGYETALDIESFTLKVNYERYDGDYEGLEYAFSVQGRDGGYTVRPDGGYAVVELGYGSKVNMTIYKDGKEDDYIGASFSTSKINEDYELEVYLMQGTDRVAFNAEVIRKEGGIVSAYMTDVDQVEVRLLRPVKTDGLVGDVNAATYGGFALSPEVRLESVSRGVANDSEFKVVREGYADYFIINTAGEMDLAKKYDISLQGHEGVAVQYASSLYTSEGFERTYTYKGDDLGATYTKERTTFKVWSPTASEINLLLYENGEAKAGDVPIVRTAMTLYGSSDGASDGGTSSNDASSGGASPGGASSGAGIWTAEVSGDIKGKYYVYEVTANGRTNLAVDPYAKAVGVNGMRGMVVDLSETDPNSFRTHALPEFNRQIDAIIYEVHVRDLSMNPNSGIQNKGKFLGFIESGTKNTGGLSTGLDHMKELGITHVHLLPSFDYKTIDEAKLEDNKFNWGYDPQNYNVPEGSYSTDPYNGEVRIREFKEMVMGLHENGLRVVMDVVYNHTFTADDSNLTYLVPGYYYRTNANGGYTNGSGCGNETASERAMVRKMIVDSVVYWAKEYRIDGFRFDLMGLHDIDTMNEIRAELDKVDPSIIVYGEGWTGGTSPLPDGQKALKANVPFLDARIAAFSDDIRDAIKGSVFNASESGFANSGKRVTSNRDEAIKFGIVASVSHPQVNLSGVTASSSFWAKEPSQTISYVSAHDNLSLWDKLKETNKLSTEEELVQINKLAAAIVLTSQGIPFFQAGEELARSKKGNDNSYNAPDNVNMIDWDNKTKYNDLFEYYKGLIALRKAYGAFRLGSSDEIRDKIEFLDTEFLVVAYTVKDAVDGKRMLVAFNGNVEDKVITIDADTWDVLVDGDKAGTKAIRTIKGGEITIPAKTAYVLLENPATKIGRKYLVWIVAGVAGVLAAAGGVFLWLRGKKR